MLRSSLALLMLTAMGLTAAGPAGSPATAPATAPAPSADDLFASRLSGGTRGTSDRPAVFLLLPDRPAAVADPRPTILWYLDRDTPADQEVVVSRMVAAGDAADRRYTANAAVHLTLPGPSKAGLQRLDLKRQAAELPPGVYKVTVLVWQSPDDVAGNPFSTGFLRRVAAAPAADQWYPKLLDLCDRLDHDPAAADLHRARRQLLSDAGVFGTFNPPAAVPGLTADDRAALATAEQRAAASQRALLDRLDPVAK